MRLVIDTDAVVAAMRSPTGGAAAVLRLVRNGAIEMAVTVPLALEYEAVCMRDEHLAAAGLSSDEGQTFVDAVLAMAKPTDVWFLWRPQLRDPGDELVLEAAVNAGADAIMGFNRRDFTPALGKFGIEFLRPGDILERVL